MEIIKPGKIPSSAEATIRCPNCECVFRFSEHETYVRSRKIMVDCPHCDMAITFIKALWR